MIKGVCETCRESKARDKPGHTVMPSALPDKFTEEVKCVLMLYKQEPTIFYTIHRCIRYATGMEMPEKTMTSFLDANQQCWMQFGPAN
eukprot:8034591-Pyramimonas_sp.AAC.1